MIRAITSEPVTMINCFTALFRSSRVKITNPMLSENYI